MKWRTAITRGVFVLACGAALLWGGTSFAHRGEVNINKAGRITGGAFAMAAPIQLATGLGGAIGSDYRTTRNQLVFVEFNGKISRINSVLLPTVSEGTATIPKGYNFDFDQGIPIPPTAYPVNADVVWLVPLGGSRSIFPTNGAQVVNLGKVNYDAITPDYLQTLSYSALPINGALLPIDDVFAVRTSKGNYAKVKVVGYSGTEHADIRIQWVTYLPGKRYEVLGTGYTNPEDIVVSSDETHAYVTERGGNLLRVDLTSANRTTATTKVISSGMTQPQQLSLDEAHNQIYVVEFANPGQLLRIDLTSGEKTPLLSNENGLEFAIGLLAKADFSSFYVSEQTLGPEGGRISRVSLEGGKFIRKTLISHLTAPFFMTWADAMESGIYITERDPANKVTLINLTQVPVSKTDVTPMGVPFRPSSVALVAPNRIVVCSDQEIVLLDLTGGVFGPTRPTILGIGHVPADKITNGYATTAPDYFFPVKDAPFGGTLPVMINHDQAFRDDKRYYKLVVKQGATIVLDPKQSWTDYKLDTNVSPPNFVLSAISPNEEGLYEIRHPDDLWYNHWLGYMLDTSTLASGLYTIEVTLYSTKAGGPPLSSDSLNVQIDNQSPLATIDKIKQEGAGGGGGIEECGIVEGGPDNFTFIITARDAEEHLLSWNLTALWGNNKSKPVDSDSYDNHASSTRKWAGIMGEVPSPPSPPWNSQVLGDPKSGHCAYTFFLEVWDRTIDGYGYIHPSVYRKSITIMVR